VNSQRLTPKGVTLTLGSARRCAVTFYLSGDIPLSPRLRRQSLCRAPTDNAISRIQTMINTKIVRAASVFFLVLIFSSIASAQTPTDPEKSRWFRESRTKLTVTGSTWKENEISVGNVHGQALYIFDVNNTVTRWFLGVIVNGPLSLTGDGLAQFQEVGKYSIDGDSVHIELPKRSFAATVSDSEIKGYITQQGSDKKQAWKIQKTSAEDDRRLQELGIYSNPNKSRGSETTPGSTSSATKLKPGTYRFEGAEDATFPSGASFSDKIIMRIKIESIGADRNVKAELYRGGGKGQLKGNIDDKGNLQLEGPYIDPHGSGWNFKLKAIVKADKLINGNYLVTRGGIESKGTFDVAIMEDL
jgi:hypothetical protein